MKPRISIILAIVVLLAVAGAGINFASRMLGGEPTLRLVLNIPASRLDVYEQGQRIRSYDVSVGARGFETPPGNYKVFRVVWNPWWHPPKSEWAQGRKVAPPGPLNPMGRVKLQFAPLLYLHGTTDEGRLGAPASHGCVRMSNADVIELARLIHDRTTRVPESVLDALASSPRQTRTFGLSRPVPLSVSYDIVEVYDGNVIVYPDVYRRKKSNIREQVVKVLEKEGIDVARVDPGLMNRLSKQRIATRLTVPLDTLLADVASEGSR